MPSDVSQYFCHKAALMFCPETIDMQTYVYADIYNFEAHLNYAAY